MWPATMTSTTARGRNVSQRVGERYGVSAKVPRAHRINLEGFDQLEI